MVGVFKLIARFKFWINADRIGPDMPLTHWMLFFKFSMNSLCQNKFKLFGSNSEFRPGSYAESCTKISIGSNVVIRPGSFLFADPSANGGGIVIEDKVLIGAGVHIYTNNHRFSDTSVLIFDQGYPPSTEKDSVYLLTGCWIGAGSIILPGVTVGRNSVIGAGSIVTKSIPEFVVAAGNPARIIRTLA